MAALSLQYRQMNEMKSKTLYMLETKNYSFNSMMIASVYR